MKPSELNLKGRSGGRESTFTAPLALPSTATAAAPSAQAAPACQTLNLVLGPLNLNVLGNLLCQVANLFNGGGALQPVADLLNQILGILNGL